MRISDVSVLNFVQNKLNSGSDTTNLISASKHPNGKWVTTLIASGEVLMGEGDNFREAMKDMMIKNAEA